MTGLFKNRIVHLVALAMLLLGGAVATAGPASADRGVSLTIGKFEIREKLTKGREYSIAGFGVRNPGSEETTYRLGLMHVEGQELAPDAWFAFEKGEVTVAGGASTPVGVTLKVPGTARPGTYKAYLRAEMATGSEGTSVGGAAAAPVIFEVKSTNLLEDWRIATEDFFDTTAPWGYVVPAGAGALLVLWLLRKNFTISLGRRA